MKAQGKRGLFLAIAGLATVLAGCGGDDPPDPAAVEKDLLSCLEAGRLEAADANLLDSERSAGITRIVSVDLGTGSTFSAATLSLFETEEDASDYAAEATERAEGTVGAGLEIAGSREEIDPVAERAGLVVLESITQPVELEEVRACVEGATER